MIQIHDFSASDDLRQRIATNHVHEEHFFLHDLLLFIIQLLQFGLLDFLEVFNQARNRFEVRRGSRENLFLSRLWERVKLREFLVKNKFIVDISMPDIDAISVLDIANGQVRHCKATGNFIDMEDLGSNELFVLEYLIHQAIALIGFTESHIDLAVYYCFLPFLRT
ncbi:hypothetical protein PENTCL1PPCAC_5955 [Pristionchus entomophagus]|uniref:Uncharacterized protein n=1 Tax=Pristionchus entomophagus TaxID=358040 RepID=A0AAV5SLG4_9BILA|nr:hypothetical protein PENTCL1PPCAC_5955 [Pristionchus entomophagus]